MGTLVLTFLKIGALAFGETELAMIEREFVDRRRVLTHRDLTDALTYTKALPGSTVVQIVAFLAFRLGGWTASAVATLAYLLPSTALMMALAAGFALLVDLPWTRPALSGLTAAAVGLLFAMAWRLGKRHISIYQPLGLMLAAGAVIGAWGFGLNVGVVVLVAGLIGVSMHAPAWRRAVSGAPG